MAGSNGLVPFGTLLLLLSSPLHMAIWLEALWIHRGMALLFSSPGITGPVFTWATMAGQLCNF